MCGCNSNGSVSVQGVPKFSRIFVVTGGALAAGNPDTVRPMRFPVKGRVVGLQPYALGDGSAAGRASLSMQVAYGRNQTQLCQDKDGANYVAFAAMGDGSTPAPLDRPVDTDDVWNFLFKHRGAAGNYTPEVAIWFLDDDATATGAPSCAA